MITLDFKKQVFLIKQPTFFPHKPSKENRSILILKKTKSPLEVQLFANY